MSDQDKAISHEMVNHQRSGGSTFKRPTGPELVSTLARQNNERLSPPYLPRAVLPTYGRPPVYFPRAHEYERILPPHLPLAIPVLPERPALPRSLPRQEVEQLSPAQIQPATLAPRATNGAEPLPKSLPVDAVISSGAEDSKKLILNHTQYTLLTRVRPHSDPRYQSSTTVLAEFFLLPRDHQGDVPDDAEPAGRLSANIVDKSFQRPTDLRPAYVSELLDIDKQADRPLSHPHEKSRLSELQATLKHIHERNGEPRKEYSAHKAALTTDKIHLVVEFFCEPEYWGSGLAQQAMQSYERALVRLPQATGLRTMILSPAPLQEFLAEVADPHSQHEIENRLVKSYVKSGYTVWSRVVNKRVQCGFIIMGKSLDEDTKETKQPASAIERRMDRRAAEIRRTHKTVAIQECRAPVRNLATHVSRRGRGRKRVTWEEKSS